MFARGLRWLMVGFGCMLAASSAVAQNPTDLAETSAEYNAYVYSYSSWVVANGLAGAISSGEDDQVANLIADYVEEGFFLCYDALMEGDDSQWAAAANDLKAALFWCETLEVFSANSQSSTVLWQINTLKWYLELAIENAEDATPVTKWRQLPKLYPYQLSQQARR